MNISLQTNLKGMLMGITSLFTLSAALAQISVTTTNSFLNNNGNGGVTFNLQNTNNFPIIITEIEGVCGAAGLQPAEFHFNNSPVNGAPASISPAAGWTLVAATNVNVVTGNSTTTATIPLFTGLSFVVPANTTIGMYVYVNGQRYFTHPGGTTTDSASGVRIISGTNISYGGGAPPTVGTFTPRAWIGTIKFVPAIACSSNPTAGNATTSMNIACANQNFILSLANDSIRQNLTYQWLSSTGANGPWTILPNDTTRNVTENQTASRWYRCVVRCGSNPDTSTAVLVTTPTTSYSGNYTVNPTLPQSATNFQNLRDLVASLTCVGVSGPVTIDVAPGITLNGSIAFGNITGTSATNTITINGHGATISSAATPVVTFSGSRFITWDSLNVLGSGNFTGFGIHIGNISERITISNSNINVGMNTTATSNAGIVISGSTTAAITAGNNGRYITINNNNIVGGYYGISMIGAASYQNAFGNIITNNTISNFYFYGIYLANTDTTLIANNDINRISRATISTFYGIYGTTTRKSMIYSNKIHDAGIGSYTAYPIWFATSLNSIGHETEIINNAIWNINSTGLIYGLYFSSSTTGFKIWHNTVNLTTDAGSGTVRAAFFAAAPNSVNFRNNILRVYGSGTGTKHIIYVTTTSASFASFHNVLNMAATAGTNHIGFWSANRTSLADWRAASLQDTNSVNTNPVYFDEANGVLLPMSSVIDNLGTPVGVTNDIMGAARSITTPDIGAYEFVGVNNDLILSNPQLVYASGCNNNNDTLKATITNSLGSLLDFSTTPVSINWRITGPVSDSGVFTISNGTLGVGNNMVVNVSNTINRTVTGNYTAKLYLGTSLNNNLALNDTVVTSSRPAYSGSITVGAGNFPNLQVALDSLAQSGVCGPVTINIPANQPIFNGNIHIRNIPGVSATKNVIINGNGNTIQSSVSPVVRISSARFIIIDSLNINAATGANVFGVHIGTQSEFVTIRKSTINLGITSTATTSAGIVVSGSPTSATTDGNNAKNITIDNNNIIGGYYSIIMVGQPSYLNNSGHIITNNKCTDFHFYGIYLNDVDTAVVANNEISRPARAAVSTLYGIYLNQSRNVKIRYNRIFNTGTGNYAAYPIYISISVNSVGFPTEIINNAIYNINTSGTLYGIYLLGTRERINVYHNTVVLHPTTSAGAIRGIFMSTAPNFHDVKNNIISIQGAASGIKYCIYVTTPSLSYTANKNVFHIGTTGGTNNIGFWGADMSSLANWIAATNQDSQSVSFNPVFVDLNNNNIIPQSGNIDNIGLPLGLTVDLAGATRSTTTPDVGALEFTGLSGDLSLVSASLKRSSVCYSNADTVKLTLRNLIGTTVDFALNPTTLVWEVTGPINTTDSIVLTNGTVAQGASAEYFMTNVNMSTPGSYSLRAYVRPNAVNTIINNDTLYNAANISVQPIISVTPKTATAINATDSFNLRASSPLFASSNPIITEISHFKTTVGAPVGGWPTYLIADDYIEITGVPNSDLSGFTLEEWNGTTIQHTVTFPTNTLFGPNGTMVVATGQLGASVPSPANFYYHSGNTATHGSTTVMGYILKNPGGTIVDAVVYGAMSFPVAAGVTPTIWTGTTPAVSSSGNRLNGPDNNTATNWINSGTSPQDPNVLNTNVPLPQPSNMTGFNWYFLGNPIDTNATIKVGPYTTPGIYRYVAVYTNTCGTFTDTVTITAAATVPVTLTKFEGKLMNNDALLTWSTAAEKNNDYFLVQKSNDGVHYTNVGKVKGIGNSNQLNTYSFIEESAFTNRNGSIYYRLIQVDYNGAKTTSQSIVLSNLNNDLGLIVYPNPSHGVFTYIFNSEYEGNVNINITNTLGVVVYEKKAIASTGANELSLEAELPNGMYVMTLELNGQKQTTRLLIQK